MPGVAGSTRWPSATGGLEAGHFSRRVVAFPPAGGQDEASVFAPAAALEGPMLTFSLVAAGALLVGANLIGYSRAQPPARAGVRPLRVAGWCLLLFVFGLGCQFYSPLLMVNSLLVFLAAFLCAPRQASRTTFFLSTCGAMLAAYLIVGTTVCIWLSQDAARFPFESLQDRLAYEQPRSSPAGVADHRPADGGAATDRSGLLEQVETRMQLASAFPDRSGRLKRLHEDFVGAFVNSDGFGVFRMRSQKLTLPDDEPIQQPWPVGPSADPTVGADRVGRRPPPGRETLDKAIAERGPLWDLHAVSVTSFANPRGFGYVKDRRRVAGFQPHRFQKAPEPIPLEKEEWRVARLELVSLLKHDPPAVYVSDNLPRMRELRDAPVRPLDEFEADAVARLHQGEDIVSGEARSGFRAVGAIRAAKQCLDCHAVQRADLLGAFSYQFVPD
jgi:hypothetical protein